MTDVTKEAGKQEPENLDGDECDIGSAEMDDLQEITAPHYGKYGTLREEYLKENRHGAYTYLKMTGKLDEHLAEFDEQAKDMVNRIVEQNPPPDGLTDLQRVGYNNMTRMMAEELLWG